MLLEAPTRQIFVDLGFASKAADYLKVCATEADTDLLLSKTSQRDDREGEFLASRLLFLCTYETNLDFEDLFERNNLIESLDSVRQFGPTIVAALTWIEPLSPCRESQRDRR